MEIEYCKYPTEFQGLIKLALSCRTHPQQTKGEELYLAIPETQGTPYLGPRTRHLVLRHGDALGVVGNLKKKSSYQAEGTCRVFTGSVGNMGTVLNEDCKLVKVISIRFTVNAGQQCLNPIREGQIRTVVLWLRRQLRELSKCPTMTL